MRGTDVSVEAPSRPVFIEALRRLAAERAADVAVVHETRRTTYAALWDEVSSLAAWLGRQGFGPGDVVGITIKDEYRNLLASLAAMHAGLAQVTLATHEPAAQRESVARRAGAVAVLAETPEFALPQLSLMVPDFGYRAAAEPQAQPGDGTCLFLSSSGTTGRAKLIPIGQRHLVAQSATYQWPRRRNVFYRPASIEFSNVKRQRLYMLASGDMNVLLDAGSDRLQATCDRFGITWLPLSVPQARRAIAIMQSPLSRSTGIRIGGSRVPMPLRRDLARRLGATLNVVYATQEVGSIATAGPTDHDGEENIVGFVHPGVEVEIVDEEDRLLPPAVGGHVRVRSAGMATRYHGDPEATARAFRDGWFYPGDVARRDASGRLVFEGRSDDMMNLASINIFPSEIERVVDGFPGVVESAAFAMTSTEFGDIPVLAVVANNDVSTDDILGYARKSLGLRAPRKIFRVDELPRNLAGKLLRGELQGLLPKPGPREPVDS